MGTLMYDRVVRADLSIVCREPDPESESMKGGWIRRVVLETDVNFNNTVRR